MKESCALLKLIDRIFDEGLREHNSSCDNLFATNMSKCAIHFHADVNKVTQLVN